MDKYSNKTHLGSGGGTTFLQNRRKGSGEHEKVADVVDWLDVDGL